jgi:hypothetical protein
MHCCCSSSFKAPEALSHSARQIQHLAALCPYCQPADARLHSRSTCRLSIVSENGLEEPSSNAMSSATSGNCRLCSAVAVRPVRISVSSLPRPRERADATHQHPPTNSTTPCLHVPSANSSSKQFLPLRFRLRSCDLLQVARDALSSGETPGGRMLTQVARIQQPQTCRRSEVARSAPLNMPARLAVRHGHLGTVSFERQKSQ